MVKISFAGFVECRLATDPDPADESRGISGWTFALPGEPDLDRVLRLQPKSAVQRPLCPKIGVTVSSVGLEGNAQSGHPLVNKPVDFLGDPVFEGRSGLASEDTEEPVLPFHIQIGEGDLLLRREFRDPSTGEWRFEKSRGAVARPEIPKQIGISDVGQYQKDRQTKLEDLEKSEKNPVKRLALQKRLKDLKDRGFGPVPFFVGLRWRYVLEGPWYQVVDQKGLLKHRVDGSSWIADFWVGCWDADTLSGYLVGSLEMPGQPN